MTADGPKNPPPAVRRRVRLTRSGWLTLALAGAGVVLGRVLAYPELMAAGAALAGAVVIGVLWAVAGNPPITAERRLASHRLTAGDAAVATLVVTNRSRRRRARGLAADVLDGTAVTVEIPAIGAGETERVDLRLPDRPRGRYQLGPLRLHSSDPLGLARTTRVVGDPVTLWVHPRVHAARGHGIRGRREPGSQIRAGATGGVELLRLDRYVAGDDPRLVHWPTTLRVGSLIVRRTATDHHPQAVVVLDTAASSYDGDRFERAVEVAASVSLALARAGWTVHFETTGGLRVAVTTAGRRQLDLLDELAAVKVGTGARQPGTLVPNARRHEGALIAVTGGSPRGAGDVGRWSRHAEAVTLLRVGEPAGIDRGRSRGGAPVVVATAPTSEKLVVLWGTGEPA